MPDTVADFRVKLNNPTKLSGLNGRFGFKIHESCKIPFGQRLFWRLLQIQHHAEWVSTEGSVKAF